MKVGFAELIQHRAVMTVTLFFVCIAAGCLMSHLEVGELTECLAVSCGELDPESTSSNEGQELLCIGLDECFHYI